MDELARIEGVADDMGMALTRILFEVEDEMKPSAFFIWYDLIQKLGDISDFAEDVGDRLRLLIAR